MFVSVISNINTPGCGVGCILARLLLLPPPPLRLAALARMRGGRFAVAPTGREDVASCQRKSTAFFHNNNTEQSCIFGCLILGLRAPDGAGDPALDHVTAGFFQCFVGYVFR